mgnify:CR=1 FL=1
MGFKCGIVGLPNVGKSTLFNALTRSRKAEAANYPFCTIDPNIGVVVVPDARLEPLARIAKTPTRIPAAIEFVDIAGLIKGASQSEDIGRGSKFLAHIREVDAIVTPVSPFPAFKLGEKMSDPLEMYLSDIYTITGSLAGIPCMNVPCGTTAEGLPVGMQILTKHFDELFCLL